MEQARKGGDSCQMNWLDIKTEKKKNRYARDKLNTHTVQGNDEIQQVLTEINRKHHRQKKTL